MRMKRLTISLRLFLTFFSLVLAENLLGQEPAAAALSGSGTENEPWLISSTTEWNAFADAVNGGYSYSGKYIKLMDDIEINVGAGDKMAGVFVGKDNSDNRPFNGTFDGNGNTITFNCGTVDNPINVTACTLFRYTTGVTINDLTVTGTIVSSKKFAAGLIGWYHGSKSSKSYITNCTSHITINCSKIEEGASNKKWDCSTGGFIGQVEEGNVVFTNCVFDGSILKGTQANANRCAGFISYIQSNSVTYTYCTMAGTIDMAQPSNYSTFNRNGKNSFSKTYYITNYGDYEPSPALTTAPTDDIAKIYTKNNTNYYVPGAVITGMATTYSYSGSPVEINPVIKYYGKTLTRGTDYIIKINGTLVPTADTPTLNREGDYTFTIEGIDDFGGSYSTTIHVLNYNEWVTVMTQLADDSGGARVVDLSADISAAVNDLTNTALVVRGTVTLNLNGHTINRSLVHVNEDHEVVEDLDPDYNGTGLVIIVESGASLTINGPGTITGGFHKGDEDYNDGGGIYNKGTLILYNNVEVVGNKVIKRTDGTAQQNLYSGRGGGIYSGNGSTLIITGGKITDNDSKGGGGGIFSDEANQFDMTNARVAFNVSEDKGGGVRVVISGNKTAYLTNCKIMNNSATTNTESKGGGIYMEGKGNNACLNMVNDTLIANTSSLLGGAIYSHQGTIYTEHCHFFNNVSYDAVGITSGENSYGGAVYLHANGSSISTFIINGGSIIGDWSKTNGGGIYVCPGAILKVKGLVVITDNVQMGDDETSSSNNVYLGGTDGVIEVIGQLDPKSVINITPNPDHEGTYVTFDEGTHSADPDDDLSYFVLDINNDDDEYNIILDNSGNVIVYEPYSWGDASTWDGSTIAEFSGGTSSIPDSNSDVTIHRTLIINTGDIAYAKSISVDEHCRVVIEDGGQLIANSAIAAKVEKKVVAADEDNQTGWYLISSSVANPNIGNSTNLITEIWYEPTYDLYRFNENAELQWENYRADHEGFTTLQNGRGYLYRNADNHKINIDGTLNVSDVTYNLSCSGSELKGFNIIGNPYSHNVYKGAASSAIPNGDLLESKYYMLNPTTSEWDLTDDGTVIPPLTGILVQATKAGTLTMNNSTSGASGAKDAEKKNDNIWFTISNNDYEDRACVEFKEGHGLNKIEHLNEESPMLYIHHNGEDFASVDMSDNTKQFNLNLEAKTTGKYTLSVEPQGAYKYLHLIDRLAEKDIDLLVEKEYSFIGSPADYANRFIVRLEHSDNVDSSVFAYQSGNEIVVSGEGELQIFDVMGRLVMQKHVSGVEAVEKPMATGVYVLKLNENIQKIIVK